MSDKTIPPTRGGALYEVTCLRTGVDARTAKTDDFFTVQVRAPNALSARLMVRNFHADVGEAFEAVKLDEATS